MNKQMVFWRLLFVVNISLVVREQESRPSCLGLFQKLHWLHNGSS